MHRADAPVPRILPTGMPGGPRWNRVGSQMRIEPPPGPRRPRTCGRGHANPRTGHQRYSPHARCPRSATPASVRSRSARSHVSISEFEQCLLDDLGERWMDVENAAGHLVEGVPEAHRLDKRLDE